MIQQSNVIQVNRSCTEKRSISQFFQDKAKEAGFLDVKSLVKQFQLKKPSKVYRCIEKFYETGCLNEAYFKTLCSLLNITSKDFDLFSLFPKEEYEMCILKKNLDLLLSYQNQILATPRFANLELACSGLTFKGKFTLGELLYYWNWKPDDPDNDTVIHSFVEKECCGNVLVYRAAGSPFSGRNIYSGICTKCKKIHYGRASSVLNFIKQVADNRPNFDRPTSDTVKADIDDLLDWLEGLLKADE